MEENSFFPKRSGKTASQIIAEAKASIDHHGHSGGGKVLHRKSNDHPQPQRRRLLSTDRPFTPRVTDRNLMSRPISAILHKNNVIIEEELEDGFANSALKLIPLSQYCTTNFKRESLLKRSNSACSSSTSCQTGSSSSKFLPSINNGTNGICSSRSGSSRSQFRYHRTHQQECFNNSVTSSRPKTVIGCGNGQDLDGNGSTKDPLAAHIFQLQVSQDDMETAHALEQVCDYSVEEMHSHKKELVQIISRHLSSDNARVLFPLAELLLLLSRPRGSRTLMILATKVIFKLARDDLNDNIFMSRRTLELLLTSLGNHCPKKDSEAFVYAYGGLKFLTLNGDISELLSDSLGFLHLSVLHMKLLCDKEVIVDQPMTSIPSAAVNQVMFQVTSCIRNLCNLDSNSEKFVTHLDGPNLLMEVVKQFKTDVDVSCNVSRILSVLTATFEDLFIKHCIHTDMISALFSILSRHHHRRDIVVRVTFVLGNLAARSPEARIAIGQHPDTMILLPALLGEYLLQDPYQDQNSGLQGSTRLNSDSIPNGTTLSGGGGGMVNDEAVLDFQGSGNNEDTALKIIRVFANSSIDHETGSLLALNESIINELLNAVASNHHRLLLLPSLATLNNLSFYMIVNQIEIYKTLRSLLLNSDHAVAAEAARVCGNLSRRQEVRNYFYDDEFFKCTVHLIDSGVDRDFVSALVGIVINLMSDKRHTALKLRQKIKDWDLACLVCQALWNYCIDCHQLSEVIEPKHIVELEDVLVYLLEAYNDTSSSTIDATTTSNNQTQRNSETGSSDSSSSCETLDDDLDNPEMASIDHIMSGAEFCQVALTLLKRVLDDSPRKVELLLND